MRKQIIGLFAAAALAVTGAGVAQAQGTPGKFSPPYDVKVYVRGGFNDWGLANEMRFDSNAGEYIARVKLAAGSYEFKIASEDWSTVDVGFADNPFVVLGTPQRVMQVGYNNLFVQIVDAGSYKFTLDALDLNNLTLLVEKVAQGTGPSVPPTLTRQVSASVSGYTCYDGPNGEYRCRYFSVIEGVNPISGRREPRLDYTFYRMGGSNNVWGYRYLNCPVDPAALNITPNRATFNAQVVDPMAGACSNYGSLCVDSNCQDWPWTETVVVKGEMTNPGYQQSHVSIVTNEYKDDGTSDRQQCHGGTADSIHGGGVSFSTTGGNMIFFPFGSMGTNGQAWGNYFFDTCTNTQK